MKVTRGILREMIEAELSLLAEDNETDVLTKYFDLGTDSKIKNKDRGDIVSALQTYLKSKYSESNNNAVKTAILQMGEPDGMFGPLTLSAVKAVQKLLSVTESGEYDKVTHSATGNSGGDEATAEADGEDAAAEEGGDEASAEATSQAWAVMVDVINDEQLDEIKNLDAEGMRELISKIKVKFANSFRKFLEEDFLWRSGGNLQPEAKTDLMSKFLSFSATDLPKWTRMTSVEQSFSDELDKITSKEGGSKNLFTGPSGHREAKRIMKEEFRDDVLSPDSIKAYKLSVHIGSSATPYPLKGIARFKAVIVALFDVKNRWDEFENTSEPAQENQLESISYDRLSKLAGI